MPSITQKWDTKIGDWTANLTGQDWIAHWNPILADPAGHFLNRYLTPDYAGTNQSPQAATVTETDAYGNIVYGEMRIGGILVYVNVSGANNDNLDYVVAHSFTDLTHGVEAVTDVWIDDHLIPDSAIDASGNVTSGDYAGLVQIWRYTGTQTTVDSVLHSDYGSDPDVPWDSTAIGKGVVYTHIRCVPGTDEAAFKKAFQNGAPQKIEVLVKGEKVYDTRTSMTAWSDNPVLCIRDFLTRTDNGMGIPASIFDDTIINASANVCDETITYPGTSRSGPRFTCNGVAALSNSGAQIVETMLTAMVGELVQAGGALSLYSGSFTASSGTIDQTFLRGAAGANEPSQGDRYNYVKPSFLDKNNNYQKMPAEPYPATSSATYSTWVSDDGGYRIDHPIDLPFTDNADNAQVIGQIIGNQSRYLGTLTLECNARGWIFKTHDRVTVDLPEIGVNGVLYKIVSVQLHANFGATLQLVMDDASIWGWDNTIAREGPYVGSIPGVRSIPGQPQNIYAKSKDNGVGLGCDALPLHSFETYHWEVATAAVGPYSEFRKTRANGTQYDIEDDNSTYYFRVRAFNGTDYGPYSLTVNSHGKIVSDGADNTASNLPAIINPYFTTGDLTGWTSDHGSVYFENGSNGPEPTSTSYAVFPPTVASEALRNTARIPVYPGQQLRVQGLVGGHGSPDGSIYVRISWRDGNDAEILPHTDGQQHSGNGSDGSYAIGTAPAGAVAAVCECVTESHTTGYYTCDNFAHGPLPDHMGQVPDDSASGRYAAVQNATNQNVTIGLTLAAKVPGANLVYNPMFQLGTKGYAGVDAAWVPENNSIAGWCADLNLAVSSGTHVIETARVPCSANDVVSVALEYWLFDAVTAGDLSGDISFYDSSGTAISRSGRIMTVSGSTSGFTHVQRENEIAPAGTASVSLRVFSEGASGGHVLIRRLKLEKGATCTPFNDDATQYGNQLTVAGSGVQIGNGLNLIPLNTGGYATSYWTGASVTIGQTSISSTAGNWHAGSETVAYNSWSISGLTANTAYYIGIVDPTYAGGTPDVIYSTNAQDIINAEGVIFAFKGTTQNTGGGGGGGGYGTCVALTMWLCEGLRAARAHPHTVVDCADGYQLIGRRRIQAMSYYTEPCVRLVADNGAALICSHTTPFTLPDGSSKAAPDMQGQKVLTDQGGATIIEVTDLGAMPVARISVGGLSYAAGEDPENRIYSHNTYKP